VDGKKPSFVQQHTLNISDGDGEGIKSDQGITGTRQQPNKKAGKKVKRKKAPAILKYYENNQCEYSLFLFQQNNKFRKLCYYITNQK